MNKQLTEMQKFALEFINKQKREISPSYLGAEWYYYKNGKYCPCSSRDRFGTTSAAYRTLRNLSEMGLINKLTDRTFSGYSYQ